MSEGIAYQNKDIEFKVLSEAYRERSFQAYGLDLPRIKEVLPTNLPVVLADEKRMDNLFLLEDDTYAVVEYESKNEAEDRIKYVNYIARVVERLYQEQKKVPVLRMIVLYTADVVAAEPVFEMGCMSLCMEQVFVSRLPAEEIFQEIKSKLEDRGQLTEEELMQMIILPLAERGREGKRHRVKQVIALARQIEDEQDQKLIYSGLLVVSDKFIDREDAETIRREIRMTKVGKMIFEDGLKEGEAKGRKEERVIAVFNMLKLQVPERQILNLYTKDELEEAKQLR